MLKSSMFREFGSSFDVGRRRGEQSQEAAR